MAGEDEWRSSNVDYSTFINRTEILDEEGVIKIEALPPGVGTEGDSAYEVAVNNGFVGTEQEWLLSLIGDDGAPGTPGQAGYTPIKGVDYFDGDKGDKGDPGLPGSDADVTEHEATFTHSNIHAPGSDNQDLSGLVIKVTGHSLVADTDITKLAELPKITVSATPPENPQVNDIWIQTS